MAYGIAGYVLDDLQTALDDTRGELDDAHQRLAKYETLLNDLYNWFDDRSDAEEAPCGEYRPNVETIVANRIAEVLS